jgi:predicted peptidase
MTTKTFYIESPLGKIPAILYTPSNPGDVCVVFFHGRGETGNGELTGTEGLPKLLNSTNHKSLIDKAELHGFSVLAPHLVPKITGWNVWWTPQYVQYCIDYALQNITKLPKVGVTGLSQGGGGTWTAMTDPDTAGKIFAAIPICPTPQYEGDFSLIAKNKIPVWNFHAVNDTTVNITSSRTMIQAADKFNPDPDIKFEEWQSGGHWIWGQVYAREDIYPWFLSYAPKSETIPQPAPVPTDKILYTIKTTVYESGKIISEKI